MIEVTKCVINFIMNPTEVKLDFLEILKGFYVLIKYIKL